MKGSGRNEYSDIQPMFLQTPTRPCGRKLLDDAVIVYPPTIDWNWMKQRPQQLMEQFSLHGHKVYYCNKTQSEQTYMTEHNDNLTIVHNNMKFIQETIPELKRKGKRIILWVSWSKLHCFLDQYIADFVVYDYVDDIPDWAPYLDPIVNRADLVVTSSSALQKQITDTYTNKPCYKVPNGCDLRHFQKYTYSIPKKPQELLGLSGPIVGFVGAWAHWVDHEVVRGLASAFPDVSFVIIGVEFAAKVDLTIPNIKYIGYKPYSELPQYLYHFDACLIPFKINNITKAANPVKMYEYLASGKPVIATDLPEVRNIPYVFIGKDIDQWKSQLEHVLTPFFQFNRDDIQPWLLHQTWESRYFTIKEAIRNHWKHQVYAR